MATDDVVLYIDGARTYRVFGLHTRAQAITTAGFELDQMIGDRIAAADAALANWRGAHAVTFAEGVNRVLRRMGMLQRRLRRGSQVLSAFPESPGGGLVDVVAGWLGDDDAPRVDVPRHDGTASADVDHLRAYVKTAIGQDERFATLAGTIDLDGVWADVTHDHDPLAAVGTAEVVHDVGGLVDLPDTAMLVAPLVTTSGDLSEFVAAVALAFEHSDHLLLDLLEEHPEAAVGVVDVLTDGDVDTAEGALAILQARWNVFDTAADGGDRDRIVSSHDIRAIMEHPDDFAADVVAAAAFLAHNRRFFRLLETTGNPGDRPDDRISDEDLTLFLALSAHLRTLGRDFDRFDGAAENGHRDGVVAEDDLRAVAEGGGPSAEAAQWLLDHDAQRRRLAGYELETANGSVPGLPGLIPDEISRMSVVLLAADQQIYGAYDPAAMHLPEGTIPPPPPPPYIDRGAAGSFGQDSDWSTLDDGVSETKWRTIADGAEVAGRTDAARHMNHFLDGTGGDLLLDADRILRDAPELQHDVEEAVAGQVAQIARSGRVGTAVPFGTAWAGHAFEDDNWFAAIGNVQYSVTGVATVHPPSAPGGQPTVDVDYRVHLYDRYNWDEGDDPATPGFEPANRRSRPTSVGPWATSRTPSSRSCTGPASPANTTCEARRTL